MSQAQSTHREIGVLPEEILAEIHGGMNKHDMVDESCIFFPAVLAQYATVSAIARNIR